MPFIEESRRVGALTGDNAEPGDICFKHYKAFMEMWAKEPRWRTIDKYAQRIWGDDDQRAAALALLVFMHSYGFAYEDAAKKKNGDVK